MLHSLLSRSFPPRQLPCCPVRSLLRPLTACVRACPDQYRLCPKDSELTEACFQQHPLDFDRTKQALLFNNGSRYPLKGIFVSEGTKPAGSTWARNPVPRQGEFSNGATRPNKTSTAGWVEFPPPCPWDCSGQADCPNPGTADHPGTQEVSALSPSDLL